MVERYMLVLQLKLKSAYLYLNSANNTGYVQEIVYNGCHLDTPFVFSELQWSSM